MTLREDQALRVPRGSPTHFIPRCGVCLGLSAEAVKHRCPVETWEGREVISQRLGGGPCRPKPG